MTPFCSACLVAVPNLDVNHHVCTTDGKGGYVKTFRDTAAKAQVRAVIEGVAVDVAFARDLAATPIVPKPVVP